MLDITTDKVQLGFDIATSVTIIGALLSWWWESNRRARQDRKRGIADHVKSTSLETSMCILKEFEDSYSGLIRSSVPFNSIMSNYDGILDQLNAGTVNADNWLSDLKAYSDDLIEYYESISKRRYTLISIMDCTVEGEEYINSLYANIDELRKLAIKLTGSHFNLLSDLVTAARLMDEIVGPDADENFMAVLLSNDKFRFFIRSIILNPSYASVIELHIANNHKKAFKEAIAIKSLPPYKNTLDPQIYSLIEKSLCEAIFNGRNSIYRGVLLSASMIVTDSRAKSKHVIIMLTALNNYLLTSDSSNELMATISKYQSKDYLDIKSTMR